MVACCKRQVSIAFSGETHPEQPTEGCLEGSLSSLTAWQVGQQLPGATSHRDEGAVREAGAA